MTEASENSLSRGEWFAVLLAVIVLISYMGIQFMSPSTPPPLSMDQTLTVNYPGGLQVTKNVTITPKGHEERVSTTGGADVVLLVVVPKALEANLDNAVVAGSGKIEKFAEYSLIVARSKGENNAAVAMKFENNYRDVSAITLALPAKFFDSLSVDEKTALFEELKGFDLVWLSPDEVAKIEQGLAAKVSGALAA